VTIVSLKSKVTVARPGSKSLRATVPEGIVAFLELTEGDSLLWKMEIFGEKRFATVRKETYKRKEPAGNT
jgi:hypothetical protein